MPDPKLLLVAVLATAATAHAQLTVTTTSVPAGAYNVPYSFALQASGGSPPYQWCGPPLTPDAICPWGTTSTIEGGLPPGILISADGVLSGTPECAGSYPFEVEVQDSQGLRQVSNFLTLTVPTTGPLIISTTSLPVGVVQQTYNFNLCGAGGTTPYAHDPGSNPSSNAGWSILDTQQLALTPDDTTVDLGPMAPPGLTLDLGGKLSGTPNTAGKYALSVQVIDTSSPPQVATTVLQLNILPTATLFIVNTSQPTATVGKPYKAQLQTPEPSWDPVTFAPVDANGATGTPAALASLPPGIMLSPSGAFSGVPSAAGMFEFEVHIADAFGDSLNQGVQMTVVAPTPSPITGPSGSCATTSGTSSGASLLAILILAASRRRRPATPTRG